MSGRRKSVQDSARVVQRLAALSRGTLPIWVAGERPEAYLGDDKPSRAPVVSVLTTVSLGGCCFPDVLGPPEALLKAAYRDDCATESQAEDSLTMSVAGSR